MDLRARRSPTSRAGGAPISALLACVAFAGAVTAYPPAVDRPEAKRSPRVSPASPVPPQPGPAGVPVPVTASGYSPVEPVIKEDFADPAVVRAGATYFAYGTNNTEATLPVATAPSPTGPWTGTRRDGLARLPSWAAPGWTWAPEVVPPRRGKGPYLLYFSARRSDREVQCIGVAMADSPGGPFVPLEGGPLICPLDLGGAIDPASYIEDDGTRYLLYKTDARDKAAIYLVRLSPDGLRTEDAPRKILGRDASEPVLVEAPDLVRRGDEYVLFYSAGWYFHSNYQTRYAIASSIEGPYQKAPGPLMTTEAYGGRIQGPGSADVLSDQSGDHLVFHGIRQYLGGSKVNRAMYVAALGWDGSRPVICGAPSRYEAESGRLSGCVTPLGRPRASGGRAVGPFDRPDCPLEIPVFAPVTGRYAVRIGYANRSGRETSLELTTNGATPTTLRLRATKPGIWVAATVVGTLSSGWNTLGLRRLSGGENTDYAEVDYVEVR